MKKENSNGLIVFLVISVLVAILLSNISIAVPDGATVSAISNTTKSTVSPDSRNDSKGSINVITLNTVQQDYKWKAYVGNVSGTLVLKDADDYSIYEWSSISSPTGEVYISRNDTVSWANIQCANQTHINDEETYLNMTSTSADSINSTFSNSVHKAFSVDPVGEIANSSCRSVFPWVNDTIQSIDEDALFQEVLLSDLSHIVYATIIDQDIHSYRNDSTKYDFQALVPDNAISTNPDVLYYFYLEIE